MKGSRKGDNDWRIPSRLSALPHTLTRWNEFSISYNDEKSDGGDELIAFKGWVIKVIFTEDTLSSTKAFDIS
jgi:hypothetical protein